MKITTNSKNIDLKKDFMKLVMHKIEQNPEILAKKILKNFKDDTGLKPEIKVRMVQTTTNKANMQIEVLNGDEAYKKRVIDFLKTHK